MNSVKHESQAQIHQDQHQTVDEEGWYIQTPKSARKKKRNRQNKIETLSCREKFDRARNDLSCVADEFTEIFDKVLEGSKLNPSGIICLGLGQVSTTKKSIQQLALLKLIHENSKLQNVNVQAYDPFFTKDDLELLESVGFTGNIEKLENLKVDEDTIFYMPHCPRSLYEKLLRDNATSIENLSRLLLIGNILEDYPLKDSRKSTREACPYIWKLGELFNVNLLPKPSGKSNNNSIDRSSFNDMGIQWSTSDSLSSITQQDLDSLRDSVPDLSTLTLSQTDDG